MLTAAVFALAFLPGQTDAWDADLRRLRLESIEGLAFLSTDHGLRTATQQSQVGDDSRLVLPTAASRVTAALESQRVRLEGPLQVQLRPLFEISEAERAVLLERLAFRYKTLFAASDLGDAAQFDSYEGQSGLRSQDFNPALIPMDAFTMTIRGWETVTRANLAIEPPDRDLYNNLQVLFRRGEFQACIDAIEILGERYMERNELSAVRAGALMNLQRFDDAASAYESLSANYRLPIAPMAAFYRAMIEVERGDDSLARDMFAGWNQTYGQHPLRFTVAYFQGQTLRRLNQSQEAGRVFLLASQNPVDLEMAGAARLERERLFYGR